MTFSVCIFEFLQGNPSTKSIESFQHPRGMGNETNLASSGDSSLEDTIFGVWLIAFRFILRAAMVVADGETKCREGKVRRGLVSSGLRIMGVAANGKCNPWSYKICIVIVCKVTWSTFVYILNHVV